GGLHAEDDIVEVVDQLARYDPRADSWSTLAPLPIHVAGEALVYSPANNKLYAFGGSDVDCTSAFSSTFIYDIASGTWSDGPAMPAGRAFFAASGYFNGKIYLVGGGTACDPATAQDQTWIFDIGAQTWMTGTALPQTLNDTAAGVIDGHLYVLGGANAEMRILDTIYDYNIATGTWA